MSAVVRESVINNTSGAALLVALADPADELAEVIVKRVFVAADIGTGAGQLKDASAPTGGCLAAQFYGSRILDVEISLPYRSAAVSTTVFTGQIVGVTAANTPAMKYHVVYNKNLGVSNIYLFDGSAGSPGSIIANDWVILRVRIGNSATITPLG